MSPDFPAPGGTTQVGHLAHDTPRTCEPRCVTPSEGSVAGRARRRRRLFHDHVVYGGTPGRARRPGAGCCSRDGVPELQEPHTDHTTPDGGCHAGRGRWCTPGSDFGPAPARRADCTEGGAPACRHCGTRGTTVDQGRSRSVGSWSRRACRPPTPAVSDHRSRNCADPWLGRT